MDILIYVLIWYFVGAASFVFWWTKDFDMTVSYIPIVIVVGLVGPIAFLVGYAMHGKGKEKVLFKKHI